MHKNTPYLLQLPFDIVSDINEYLDLCSRTCLMDTCQHMRYLFLSSKHLWRRIAFDMRLYNLHKMYSSLRKLGDENGLRQCIQEVVMDNCDDPDISPLVMLIKFPNLKKISAMNRKETTHLLVDIKLLQEMLMFEQIRPKSLPIERINIYHYFMDYETHLDAYQRTWDRISIHPHVQLDIKICGYLAQETELERELSLLEQRIQMLEIQQQEDRPMQNSQNTSRCQRIVKVNAQCWSCGYPFDTCWKCTPTCEGCKSKRIPPAANDNQIRLKSRKKVQTNTIDDFSVFE